MAERWSAEIAGLEAINAWTHGLGFLVSLPACLAITLIAVQEDKSMITPCLVYGISLSAMYFFSTLSHALREPKWRSRARAWDQGAVYLLIAGTYTPFIWAYVSGWQGNLLLGLVWLTAAAGVTRKSWRAID